MEDNGQKDSFVPFTKAERIEQLSIIDKEIISLLRFTADAMRSLGKQPTGEDVNMVDNKEEPVQVFQNSMNSFLRTLRTVNVGMKRQIWGLEEAGIISLDKDSSAEGEAQASHRNAPLKLDGDGKIAGLDVGWLNSRSDKVERDMEADLWKEADEFLRRVLQANNVNSITEEAGDKH